MSGANRATGRPAPTPGSLAAERAAWADFTAGMAADWSAVVDHESAAVTSLFAHEVGALDDAVFGDWL